MTFDLNWDDTSNHDLLIKGFLRDIFDSTDRAVLYESDEMIKEINSQGYEEREARMAGLSGSSVQPLADGQEVPLADPTLDDTKKWTQTRHGLGFKITEGMKKFNQFGAMKWMTRSLKRAVREYKDMDIAKMFNNATATTYATGYDGLPLASNSHTTLVPEGGTYDNYGNAALGVSSLQAAINYFDTLIDDNGDEIIMRPTKLIVNPARRWEARELLGSSKEPYTANNQINAIQDWDLKYFVWHRSNSSTFWSLLAFNDPDYDLFVYTTQAPDFKPQDYPDLSRSTVVTSVQWYTYGFGDPRGFYLGKS